MIKCYWKMKYNELITDQIMLNASKWNQFALNDMNVSQFVELEIQKRIEMQKTAEGLELKRTMGERP